MTPENNFSASALAEPRSDTDTIHRAHIPACRRPASPCGQPPGSSRMADPHALVLELLRALRSDLAGHGQRLGRIETRLSAMERTLGSLHAIGGSDREALQALAHRIDRIERHLELTE